MSKEDRPQPIQLGPTVARAGRFTKKKNSGGMQATLSVDFLRLLFYVTFLCLTHAKLRNKSSLSAHVKNRILRDHYLYK